ncbi:E3 ubiquitin-protein ligase DZIP3-like isoform X2 [Pristis pectinata]|nr:E3 ubiquitin-protein ligase DZIP3-like isoform X2 [Pristis pectinata]XP_051869308.1 E3 ubiquitin-protein ligase DZIP3-like isoform X2 [Pristis pectinata]
MNSSLDINKALGVFPSMSTDAKIKQFKVFLTAIMKNDLVCRISQVQYLLLLHYFVMALCSRSKTQDLAEAKKQIRTIEKMTKEKPECQNFLYVAYHTLGCLYYKQNRFEDAMQWFQKSKQEFEENPPTIEWTNVILKAEEITPENFEVKINEYVEKCTDPPDPIATCQHLNCQGYYKKEIYLSDPDYKGYVELFCDDNCAIQYHTTCWKKLKDSNYHGQSNQNFCSMSCINSDCKGIIVKLVIHSAAGSTQTEFQVKVPDLSPQLSTMKNEPKDTDVPEEYSKCHEQKNTEMAKEGLHSFCSTVKCRLFQEITQNRKLIENAISEIGNVSELLIECNLKEVLAEKSNKITAEIIVDHVLEWNCNFKMRRFLSLLINQDISKHPELLEWLTLILELSDQCSLYFLFSYKKILIQILNEAGNLIVNIAKKLLSRKAINQAEIKILTATTPDQRPDTLMEQMTTNKVLWQIGELVFLLAEEQDAIPKLKPLFEEFNQEFDKFNKGSVPNFGNALPVDSFSKDMDYSLFYRLLHLLIIKGTEVVLQIFDRAVPPQILKRELLKNKRILEPYHKGTSKAMVNSGEWSLLYPPNNEQPNSQRFDITLLASLMRHLKILPAPRRGWDAEPATNDHSKSAAILRLCNLRNKLLFETLNTGIKESEFAVMWDRITEILVNLGADKQELEELKSFPVEKLWEDHHRLAGYLGKPVADVMQLLLSFVQQGMTIQSKEATASSTNTVLSALPPPQEMKEKIMEPENLIVDDHSVVLIAKTKSKKKKKKSKSKKDVINEDNHQTQAADPKKHEALSIPVQENQSNNESSEQMANTICNDSTFGVIPPDSSFSVLCTATDASRTAPSLISCEVNKPADLPDQTYQSDGELDDIDSAFIVKKTNVDLYSSPVEADGATNTQEHIWQNSKVYSEIRQKSIDLETENKVLKKNLEHLMIQFKKEQQQRIYTESLISKLQEHYHQEMSRLKQQLERKEEDLKKVTVQFANERSLWNKDKAKLEDVTAKNIAKLVEATKRAVAAEVLFLECRRDNGLFQLQQAEQDCTVHLKAAEENMGRNPASASACATVDGWQAIVADIRNKIDFTKNQFDEQIALLKSGTKLSLLPQIKIPPPPPHPDAVMKHFLEQHLQTKANYWQAGSGQPNSANGRSTVVTGQPEASVSGQERIQGSTPASKQVAAWHTGEVVRGMATAGGIRGKNSFERIMEKLSTSYPQFTRSSLTDYLKEVRMSNGGSLSGLSYDEIINKVARLVESKLSERSNIGQNNPPQTSVWRSSRQQGFKPWEGATVLREEDPCVICHEELSAESMLILPCAHKFHSQCIEPWLNEQRTCPTCRLHVVLPQEFPDLPSRKIPPL